MTEPKPAGKLKIAIIAIAVLLVVNLCGTGYLLGTQFTAGSNQPALPQSEQAAPPSGQPGQGDGGDQANQDGQNGQDGQDDQASQAKQERQTKYVLYIGTNDKDTYKQEIPYAKCVKIVTKICTRYTDGCTLAQADGYWKDDSDQITKEQSIQCILEDITLDQVHQIASEVCDKLNQNSVLIETQDVTSEFYSG